ncbi:MAG TPA: TIGR04552 family protein [Anaeromyxobacteraceae bacterium]|nr:TIGR04552 family protein [Anaeromyxobacteraceae bacterium]
MSAEPKWVPVPPRLLPVEEMDLGDLETIRLLLRGGSVVDWRRLHFREAREVDHFLRLNLLDPHDAQDERRLRRILAQAVEYLRKAFGYQVAEAVARPADVRDLFLVASDAAEPRRYRRIACVVLKVMHVIHHLEARELLFRTPVREADLAERVDRRVMGIARRMKEQGLPVVEFAGNVKTRSSLITKLLAKRDTLATQIFDRVRYRIVTERRDQIAPVLHHLTEELFPFNYGVPGQTQNSLVRFRRIVGAHPRAEEIVAALQSPLDLEAGETRPFNEFSSRSYRVLNFVVDLPVRIDELIPGDGELAEDLGRVVFSLVEFQILDADTHARNEEGDSAHERYKRRQAKKVLRRLSRGLVVPKKRKMRGEE